MACLSGLDPTDCAIEHWCPPLGGRAEKAGWRTPCPMCGTLRALSIQIKNRRILWNQHCDCDRKRSARYSRQPCPVRRRHASPEAQQRIWTGSGGIVTDRSVNGMALRLAVLRAIGDTEQEAIRPEHGTPDTSAKRGRILPKTAGRTAAKTCHFRSHPHAAGSCQKPQVSSLHNTILRQLDNSCYAIRAGGAACIGEQRSNA